MRELQRKQQFKRLLYSYPSLILLLIICFFLVKGAFGIMRIERESARKVEVLESEATELALREGHVKGEIERLKTDEGVIEEIKEKFSVTQEGEHVAIIVDERARASVAGTSTAEWLKSFWQGFKNLWGE